jgi:pimeloyl-ACP methyl ester carboxylesterase
VKVSSINTEQGAFDVMRIDPDRPRCVVVFAVGRGGSPERHLPLLQTLAARGCAVIAPKFDLLTTIAAHKAELDLRIQRLETSLNIFGRSELPAVGVGHSIGAVALLALQGAEGETLHGQKLIFSANPRLARLALLAPPTDFFRRPGALCRINTPSRIWVGAKDTITPPAQARFLADSLDGQTSVEVAVDPDAGHFTFMDELPPKMTDVHPNREAFLASMADEVADFLTA